MSRIRLAKLPDRTPVKVTVAMIPELHRTLMDYSAFYGREYGVEVQLSDLVPPMLDAFLAGDRAFAVWLKGGKK